jgi:hypothetical protein
MKKINQEIDYVEAILAMRTMLSLNNASARKLEMNDFVSFEVVGNHYLEKSMTKRT